GATRRSILIQFLCESSAIGLLGGGIGIALAAMLTAVINARLMPASISSPIVALSVLVSAGVGIVAGVAPAYRGARFDPIEALRSQVQSVEIVGSEIWDFGFVAKYKGQATNPNVAICGGTPEYPQNNTHYVGTGRNLSALDVKTARHVAVIGHAIAQKLFP